MVENGSTDETTSLVRELEDDEVSVVPVRALASAKGMGNALRTGISASLWATRTSVG